MTAKNNSDWQNLEQMFLAYRLGNAKHTQKLFEELLKKINAFFSYRLGSLQDAEDLAQATLLKIHFARDRYDSELSFKTWIFTIASRCLIDHWRGYRDDPEVDFNEEALVSPTLPHDLTYQFQRDLSKALGTLKPIDRQIVYLYGVEGLSMAEIGLALGLTEGAVKLRAHRSYVALREQLASLLLVISLQTLMESLRWI